MLAEPGTSSRGPDNGGQQWCWLSSRSSLEGSFYMARDNLADVGISVWRLCTSITSLSIDNT
jgi:hypothetical protein